jgi:hypothetical protein
MRCPKYIFTNIKVKHKSFFKHYIYYGKLKLARQYPHPHFSIHETKHENIKTRINRYGMKLKQDWFVIVKIIPRSNIRGGQADMNKLYKSS